MAVIEFFEREDSETGKLHPTKVVARYKAFGEGPDGPVLQIATTGSQDRAIPGKISQTIQLTRIQALELRKIIDEIYGCAT